MIQKRERADLYDKFRQGAIPSGADFADLIRSQLNLMDDGIDISEDAKDPICFRAHGEKENFLDFATMDSRKKWRIAGRCEDMTEEGLNIMADEQSKLYIARDTGNVGINTDKPVAKLHIVQTDAKEALRIDDEGSDQTPLIIDSSGQVGIGTDSPVAKLHVSHSGSGDILRVDDIDEDATPLIIDANGNIGIGFSNPETKLAVNGRVAIGTNEDHSNASLYVDGNVEVTGTVVFSGDKGIQINAPLTSKTTEITIIDNLRIKGDDHQPGSNGNLSVAGDTTLGTYNEISENQNVVSINGKIRSGGDPDSGKEQYELEINEVITVNRNPISPQASVRGNLSVTGTNTFGNNQGDDYIYLNGTVQREGTQAVTIDDNLTVTKSATIQNATIKNFQLGSGATVNEISTDTTLSDNSNLAIPTEKAVKEYIDNLLAGSIAAFTMSVPPAGWLECNGQAVSREKYSRLFNLIGVTFGMGDGSTTFNVPNLQNQFLRGYLPGSREIGTKQSDAIASHNHSFNGRYSTISGGSHSHVYHSTQIQDALVGYSWSARGLCRFRFSAYWATFLRYNYGGRTWSETHSHGYTPSGDVGSTGSEETRPKNVSVMFCIKY